MLFLSNRKFPGMSSSHSMKSIGAVYFETSLLVVLFPLSIIILGIIYHKRHSWMTISDQKSTHIKVNYFVCIVFICHCI